MSDDSDTEDFQEEISSENYEDYPLKVRKQFSVLKSDEIRLSKKKEIGIPINKGNIKIEIFLKVNVGYVINMTTCAISIMASFSFKHFGSI